MGLFSRKDHRKAYIRLAEDEEKSDARRRARLRVEDRLRRLEARNQGRNQHSSATGRVVRSFGRGMADVAESLNTPETNRRPRIAQLPLGRADICMPINLENLKMPQLRGRDIGGRRNV